MIFASQLTVIVVLFTEVVIRTGPVLGGNCFSPNRKISSQARENRGFETNTDNRNDNGQTQSLTPRRTPPRYLHPPPSIGIMPAASYLSLLRSRSAPSTARSPSRHSSPITSSLEPISVSGPMTLTSTTSVRHSSRLSTTPEERLAALRARAFSGMSARRNRSRLASGVRQSSMPELPFSVIGQAANRLTEAGGSAPRGVRRNNRAPELRNISVVTDDGIGRREIMVRPRPTPHHRRNSSPTISPKDRPTTPPLPIIREGAKEDE